MKTEEDCEAKTREQIVGVLTGAAKLIAFIASPIVVVGIAIF